METRTFQDRLYRRRYAELITELNAAAAEEPARADTWMMLGNTYLASGHPDRCALCLHRAANLDSCPPATHEMLGGLYLRLGRLEEAEQCFHKAAVAHLGRVQSRATDVETRAECVEAAARTLVGLARCRAERGDRDGSAYLVDEAMDLLPGFAPAAALRESLTAE